jgi:hypothetical protein
VNDSNDIFVRLRPPEAPPADELCACAGAPPVKLMSMAQTSFNPLHCLDCNREVAPERIGLDAELADDIASWLREYGAVDALELASGEHEAWARAQLLDPANAINAAGLELVRRLSEFRRSYFAFWQPSGDEEFEARSTCPVCAGALVDHETSFQPQRLCEGCRIVVFAD